MKQIRSRSKMNSFCRNLKLLSLMFIVGLSSCGNNQDAIVSTVNDSKFAQEYYYPVLRNSFIDRGEWSDEEGCYVIKNGDDYIGLNTYTKQFVIHYGCSYAFEFRKNKNCETTIYSVVHGFTARIEISYGQSLNEAKYTGHYGTYTESHDGFSGFFADITINNLTLKDPEIPEFNHSYIWNANIDCSYDVDNYMRSWEKNQERIVDTIVGLYADCLVYAKNTFKGCEFDF